MTDRIEVHCGICRTAYRLRSEWAGRKGRCKSCGETFRIPAAKASVDDMVLEWLRLADPLLAENDDPPVRSREINVRPSVKKTA